MAIGSIISLLATASVVQPSGMKRALRDDSVPPLRYLGDAKLMLRQPELPVADVTSSETTANIEMLRRAMGKYGGIGIAAPQVGWWTRVFCFGIEKPNPRYPAAETIPFSVWINPTIETVENEDTCWMWEGCLSVPGMRGWVERPSRCTLRGLDEHGRQQEVVLDGLAARIAQHEFDHLDGILFPSRTPGVEFVVPQASMDQKEQWADDWPSKGSRHTALGQLSLER